MNTPANLPSLPVSQPEPATGASPNCAVSTGSASGGIVGTFLAEYAALVRRTGIYVDREQGLAMPIESASNEMETPDEHIARLYREERLSQPNTEVRERRP